MVNKIFHRLSIGLLAILAFGCVKDPQDIPPGLTSDPVFGIAGAIGNQNLYIDAGLEGWTMQPGVTIIDSVLVYTSLFSLDGCTEDCSPSMEFRVYDDGDPGQDPLSAFQKTIHTGAFEFVGSDAERQVHDIILSTHPALFMSGHSYWEDLNILETFYLSDYGTSIKFGDNLDVCFQSLAYTGCNYRQCITFDPATIIPCLSYIESRFVDDRYLQLDIKPSGTAPFQIEWWNGSTAAGIIIPLQSPASDVYVGVTVTDANGNISGLNQSIKIAQGNVDGCYFPIMLSSTPTIQSPAEYAAGKVEIIYTDESGQIWRSTAGIQNNASFNISEINYYGLSPQDLPAYKADMALTTQLFNESTGESKQLVLQQATIALGHP